MSQGGRAGITPPSPPQPQLQRQSRCGRHFPWLHLLSLPPNTEQTPSSCRTGVTSNTAHSGHMFPTPGTSAATWPRHVSSSAALGTSPLPRRPPCSSAWSSPPPTCAAVQVIVLSFSLGHLGKGRAGLGEGEGGFLDQGWSSTEERGNRSRFPGGLGTEPGWELAGDVLGSWAVNSFARTAATTPVDPCHKTKHNEQICQLAGISFVRGPNW